MIPNTSDPMSDAAVSQRDAVIAQRDVQLAKMVEAHKALVARFERINAARAAIRTELDDMTQLYSMAEDEIAAWRIYASGLKVKARQQSEEITQLEQDLRDARASTDRRDADRAIDQLRATLAERVAALGEAQRELAQVTGSRSWKLTRPLRAFNAMFGRAG